MPEPMNQNEGPFPGSRCLAGPAGSWGPATIRRANEDGTFTVEPDVKPMLLMPVWYGVTPAEVSFNDAGQWGPVFERLSPNAAGMNRADFNGALALLGFRADEGQVEGFWVRNCRELFNVGEEQARDFVLDRDAAYRLILHAGLSAWRCAELLNGDGPSRYFKLYWNQTRMGGRDPAEIRRPVTLDDAFAALGLPDDRTDARMAAFLKAFEKGEGVVLPENLKRFLCRRGVADAVMGCHPNNPALLPLGEPDWRLHRGLRSQNVQGEYGLVVMTPHQGDHVWAAAFDDREDDARVCVNWAGEDGAEWALSAPSVGLFFWDLAQTGLAWYQETNFNGGRPVQRTDIGLVPRK
jgi:hypothetical protein